jgi:hypothetical protein
MTHSISNEFNGFGLLEALLFKTYKIMWFENDAKKDNRRRTTGGSRSTPRKGALGTWILREKN